MDEQSPGHRGTHTMQASKSSKKSKRPSQPQGKRSSAQSASNSRNRNGGLTQKSRSVGAAVMDRTANIGMSDLSAHRISWIAGYTYVGNGTLGAQDDVFFRLSGSPTTVVNGATGSGMVPILASDGNVGQTYVADIEKHYSRKRVRKTSIQLVSLQPSTANSCVAWIAPVRGPGASGDTIAVATATAAPALANIMGMAGARPVSSWEHGSLDLTPYIAGGSGAKQNEFAISRDGDDASTVWGAGSNDLDLIAPCAFVIGGSNSTAGLRGTNVHAVVVTQVVDFLDFIGGMSLSNPESLVYQALKRTLRAYRADKERSELRINNLIQLLNRELTREDSFSSVKRL